MSLSTCREPEGPIDAAGWDSIDRAVREQLAEITGSRGDLYTDESEHRRTYGRPDEPEFDAVAPLDSRRRVH